MAVAKHPGHHSVCIHPFLRSGFNVFGLPAGKLLKVGESESKITYVSPKTRAQVLSLLSITEYSHHTTSSGKWPQMSAALWRAGWMPDSARYTRYMENNELWMLQGTAVPLRLSKAIREEFGINLTPEHKANIGDYVSKDPGQNAFIRFTADFSKPPEYYANAGSCLFSDGRGVNFCWFKAYGGFAILGYANNRTVNATHRCWALPIMNGDLHYDPRDAEVFLLFNLYGPDRPKFLADINTLLGTAFTPIAVESRMYFNTIDSSGINAYVIAPRGSNAKLPTSTFQARFPSADMMTDCNCLEKDWPMRGSDGNNVTRNGPRKEYYLSHYPKRGMRG